MGTSFGGLDWASQSHAVCIIDGQGSVRERLEVAHNAADLAELLCRLKLDCSWSGRQTPPIL